MITIPIEDDLRIPLCQRCGEEHAKHDVASRRHPADLRRYGVNSYTHVGDNCLTDSERALSKVDSQ